MKSGGLQKHTKKFFFDFFAETFFMGCPFRFAFDLI